MIRASPRPKTIRKTEKINLIYCTQNLRYRSLDNLVFQYRYTNRSLGSICFGHVGPSHWLRSVTSRMNPVAQLLKISFQVFSVSFYRNAIDTCTGIPPLPVADSSKSLHVDVMHQCCKPGLTRFPRSLVYSGKIGWQGCPTLRSDLHLPTRVPLRPGPSLRTPRTIFLR